MIDRILMELYDEYENNEKIDGLVEFALKIFPKDGTDTMFIGCVLILFSRPGCYKERYNMTREKLYEIVLSAKKTINESNMLLLYVERINTHKNIKKYFNQINEKDIIKFADIILEYLDDFKPNFIRGIEKKYLQ